MGKNPLECFGERDFWPPAKQLVDALGVRNPALHILKSHCIGFGIRHVDNLGWAVDDRLDALRQLLDRHLLVTADVEHPPRRVGMLSETDDRPDCVVDVAKAAPLSAFTEDR